MDSQGRHEKCNPWRILLNQDAIENSVFITIGQASIKKNIIPKDPSSYQIQSDRRLLLRLKWILDSQRFLILSSTQKKSMISRDIVLRLLHHILTIASSEFVVNPTQKDHTFNRLIVMDAFMSAFRLFTILDSNIAMDDQDFIRSSLEAMIQRWRDVSDLSQIETSILTNILMSSIDEMDDDLSQTHQLSLSLVIKVQLK
jgi:hypothetical protein